MAKITRFLLIFVFVCSLFGASEFTRFDTEFKTASNSEKKSILDGVRSVYVKSILKDNKTLKIGALKRLVSGSKSLGLDCTTYQKELETYEKSNKKSANSHKISQNKMNSHLKNLNSQKINSSQNNANSDVKLRILGVASDLNSLKLSLNRDAKRSEIKEYDLDTKQFFRRVYDIKGTLHANLPKSAEKISPELRMSQFKDDLARVVFSGESFQDIALSLGEKEIVFTNKNSVNSLAKTSSEVNLPTNKKVKTFENSHLNSKSQKVNSKNLDTQKDFEFTDFTPVKSSGKIVVLDAGHGGKDAGAIGNSLKEKNVVLNIAKKAGKILKSRGYKVFFTRSGDKFINLRDRTAFANEKKADLFVSIHANAAPNAQKAASMHGVETFFLSPSRSERSMRAANLENKADMDEMSYFSKASFLNFLNREKIIASNKLAIDLQSSVLKSLGKKFSVSDGGVREAPFWVLVGALMPAVLLEIGYITHPKEGPLLANEAYVDRLAVGIADGVDSYFAKNQ